MLRRYRIIKSLYIGIFSGILLGLILKLIEEMTSVRVYTLLLNIDFIPFIGDKQWSEPVEFMFHVIISIAIAFAFVYLLNRLPIRDSYLQLFVLSFFLCSPTIGLYFILSLLAHQQVPAWNDWEAFTYWTIAHLFYMWLLPVLYKKT